MNYFFQKDAETDHEDQSRDTVSYAVVDQSQWLTFQRLKSIFENADLANEQLTFEAVQHVLEDMNVIDTDVHPDSPRANRPAYLDSPEYGLPPR